MFSLEQMQSMNKRLEQHILCGERDHNDTPHCSCGSLWNTKTNTCALEDELDCS